MMSVTEIRSHLRQIAGSTASAITIFLTHPFFNAKSNIALHILDDQAGVGLTDRGPLPRLTRRPSFFAPVLDIYSRGGLRALYRGLDTMLLGIPNNAIQVRIGQSEVCWVKRDNFLWSSDGVIRKDETADSRRGATSDKHGWQELSEAAGDGADELEACCLECSLESGCHRAHVSLARDSIVPAASVT